MPKQFKKAACFLTVLGLLTSFVFGAHSSYAMPKQKDAKQATKVLSNSELKTLDLDELGDIDDLDDLLLDIERIVGKPGPLMNKVERLKAITYLNEKGAFLISKSSEKIAEYFNISKFTLYSDLNTVKEES